MDWPNSADYGEAVQNLKHSMGDRELCSGEAKTDILGLPMLWAGGFANVYKIHNAKTGNTWALKCFTRKVTGQADRYRHISEHLQKARLPFIVDFTYLNEGVRVRGAWFPALKMRWVEGGIRLNEFVKEYLDRPKMLRDLLKLWPKMAIRLRRKKITHADLQHGNVLLVPRADKRLVVRLIDYDGMHVPALAGTPSAELGHPAFQHPQRSRERVYSAEVDRFSHLAIYSAIHSLTVGGKELWERFNNDDNLLFRQEDFQDPANSNLFHALWELPDADSRALIGRLALACEEPLDRTPLLNDVTKGRVRPLTAEEQQAAERILGSTGIGVPAAVVPSDQYPPAASEPTADQQNLEPAVRPDLQQPEDHRGADKSPPAEQLSPASPSSDVEPKQEAGEQPGKRIGLSPFVILRLVDWPLKKLAGDGNEILHNFLRILAVVGLAVLIYLLSTDRSQRSADKSSTSPPAIATDSLELSDDSAVPQVESTESPSPAAVPQAESIESPNPTTTPQAESTESSSLPTTPEMASSSPAIDLPEPITNSIGMQFRLIPAGEFMMGSAEIGGDKDEDESPQHRVRITKPFYLAVHEVTQEQYERLMERTPSRFTGPSLPVEQVSWEDATDFCERLSQLDAEHDYRLPSEAEWEYACRAGTSTRYSCGDELGSEFAWFFENSSMQTHPVGLKSPNAWGLYDMHGNVWEWCSDWYDSDYYENSPPADPLGPPTGSYRVFRGGGWDDYAKYCRSADRIRRSSDYTNVNLGFRVVAVTPDSEASAETTMPPREPEPEANVSSSTFSEPDRELPEDHTNAIGMRFKRIPAGQFMMGSSQSDPDRQSDEMPQHLVRISRPFCLGICEVTQSEYEDVMGENPAQNQGPDLPVENVSWEKATAFSEKLSQLDERFDYRLPTEAEWEYACRSGTTTPYFSGDRLDTRSAWSKAHGGRGSHPVGQTKPNAWGLYDMHGNVHEWCMDYWAGDSYGKLPQEDPMGPGTGALRVYRGGSFGSDPKQCRSAARGHYKPSYQGGNIGFRVVMVSASRDVAVREKVNAIRMPSTISATSRAIKTTGLTTKQGKPVSLGSVIHDDKVGQYFVWYRDKYSNGRYHCIMRAASRDGIQWKDPVEMKFQGISYLGSYDSIESPIVRLENSKYRMWVMEYNRGHPWKGWTVTFESKDGINWNQYRASLKTVNNSWEDYQVRPRAIVRDSGRYLLYYGAILETRHGGGYFIGRATSPDGILFTNRAKVFDQNMGGGVVARFGELQRLVMFCTRDGDLVFATSSDGMEWSDFELLLKDVTGVQYFFDSKTDSHYVYYHQDNVIWRRQLNVGR